MLSNFCSRLPYFRGNTTNSPKTDYMALEENEKMPKRELFGLTALPLVIYNPHPDVLRTTTPYGVAADAFCILGFFGAMATMQMQINNTASHNVPSMLSQNTTSSSPADLEGGAPFLAKVIVGLASFSFCAISSFCAQYFPRSTPLESEDFLDNPTVCTQIEKKINELKPKLSEDQLLNLNAIEKEFEIFKENSICPITLEIMVAPMTVVSSGKTYSSPAIEKSIISGNLNDPLTRIPIEKGVNGLKLNRELQKTMSEEMNSFWNRLCDLEEELFELPRDMV